MNLILISERRLADRLHAGETGSSSRPMARFSRSLISGIDPHPIVRGKGIVFAWAVCAFIGLGIVDGRTESRLLAADAAAESRLDSGRSDGVAPADVAAVIVPNEDGDDTDAILKAAQEAKCGNRPMTFLGGRYSFQFKSCPRSEGIACDPNARPGDHSLQSWVFETETTVEPMNFLGWRELLGEGYYCGDPISGVRHNFYELKVKDLLTGDGRRLRPIEVGDFMRPPPPPALRASTAAVQVIAQWWSRFGTSWLQRQGRCARYDPCDQRTCKNEQGRAMGAFGPVDYTWEWNHKNADRVDRELTCGTGPAAYTRSVRDEPETGLTVDYPMPYQAKRHPMLGWYRDDDPIVLDWIAYWLRAHGVDAVLINSQAPLSHPNWLKPLFSDAPNFLSIDFAKWMPWQLPGGTVPAYSDCPESTVTAPGQRGCYADALLSEWKVQLDETYFDPIHAGHVFTLSKRDARGAERRYPLVAVWKGDELRRNMASIRHKCRAGERSPWSNAMCLRACAAGDDGFGRCGMHETRYFFRKVAGLFRDKGYDGVAIAVQNLRPRNRPGLEHYPWKELENDAGVLYIDGLYMGTEYNVVDKARAPRDSYDAFRSFAVEQYDQIVRAHSLITVPTDLDKRQPHRSSDDAIPGSTPEGFWCWLDAVAHQLLVQKRAGEPLPWDRSAVAVYNVSEWIEAGASLQPNAANGFAYLQAVARLKQKYPSDLETLPGVDPACTDGVWRASVDWRATHGWPWRYRYQTGSQSFEDMIHEKKTGRWEKPGKDPGPFITDGPVLHPSAGHSVALQWTAPHTGTVRVRGAARDRNGACGDGVGVKIRKAGPGRWTDVFSAAISNGDEAGVVHDRSFMMEAGSSLYFVVDAGMKNDGRCDATFWDPEIRYQRSP